jgi:hypothetical protein
VVFSRKLAADENRYLQQRIKSLTAKAKELGYQLTPQELNVEKKSQARTVRSSSCFPAHSRTEETKESAAIKGIGLESLSADRTAIRGAAEQRDKAD